MPNQIKQAIHYLFAKIAIRHYQALTSHFYQNTSKQLLFMSLFKSFLALKPN
jgi:hypothetical protein